MRETGQNRICSFCTHYIPCKFLETLREATNGLNVVNDSKYRKWLDHYAIFCEYFELHEILLETTIKCGLETVYFEKPLPIDSDREGKKGERA